MKAIRKPKVNEVLVGYGILNTIIGCVVLLNADFIAEGIYRLLVNNGFLNFKQLCHLAVRLYMMTGLISLLIGIFITYKKRFPKVA